MDTVNPLLDSGICNVIGIKIGQTKANSTVFRIGYKNKITPNINSVSF